MLDYHVDWSSWLVGDDYIAASTFTVTSGDGEMVIEFDVLTAAVATVWLSAGTVGTPYRVRNRIVTAEGRVIDASFTVRIVEM